MQSDPQLQGPPLALSCMQSVSIGRPNQWSICWERASCCNVITRAPDISSSPKPGHMNPTNARMTSRGRVSNFGMCGTTHPIRLAKQKKVERFGLESACFAVAMEWYNSSCIDSEKNDKRCLSKRLSKWHTFSPVTSCSSDEFQHVRTAPRSTPHERILNPT